MSGFLNGGVCDFAKEEQWQQYIDKYQTEYIVNTVENGQLIPQIKCYTEEEALKAAMSIEVKMAKFGHDIKTEVTKVEDESWIYLQNKCVWKS